MVAAQSILGTCALCCTKSTLLVLQLSARNYMVYAELLARAGYTVVEYDIEQGAGPLQVVPDTVEVRGMLSGQLLLHVLPVNCMWSAA